MIMCLILLSNMCEQNVTPQPGVYCAHEKNGYEDHSFYTYMAYIDIIILNSSTIFNFLITSFPQWFVQWN